MSTTAAVARLEYNAAAQLLSGTIGTENFSLTAYSGRSRGHKSNVTPQQTKSYLHNQAGTLQSRLATTPEIKDKSGKYIQRGGTLPPGHYACGYMADYQGFGECIRLHRSADALAIHSRWPRCRFHTGGPTASSSTDPARRAATAASFPPTTPTAFG